MAFFMSFFMTLLITFINIGWHVHYFSIWGRAFMIAWPSAAVIAFFFAPLAHQITQKIVQKIFL